MKKLKKKVATELTINEKYKFYEKAVQCPDFDLEFINEKFQESFRRAPRNLREDFCGTGYFSCEWVKLHSKNVALGMDLDESPIQYGKENHFSKLTPQQKARMTYLQANVLEGHVHSQQQLDVIVALNFSYWIFKTRKELLNYFISVRMSLPQEGMFLLDLFGGTQCGKEHVDRIDHRSFVYYWDCESFNPITNECLYKIHFKIKNRNKKYKDVFTYDWRFWSMPEIVDILKDAGFGEVQSYWEGDGKDGSGDGNFKKVLEAENCDSWISYLIALP